MRITIEIDAQGTASVQATEAEESLARLVKDGGETRPQATDAGGPGADLLAAIAAAGGLAEHSTLVSHDGQGGSATDAGAAPAL